MKTTWSCQVLSGLSAIAVLCTLLLVLGKLNRQRHAGIAENTGRAIDESIHAAAKKVSKAAVELKWAASGIGKNMGKDLDDVLAEAMAALDKATSQIESVLESMPNGKSSKVGS